MDDFKWWASPIHYSLVFIYTLNINFPLVLASFYGLAYVDKLLGRQNFTVWWLTMQNIAIGYAKNELTKVLVAGMIFWWMIIPVEIRS